MRRLPIALPKPEPRVPLSAEVLKWRAESLSRLSHGDLAEVLGLMAQECALRSCGMAALHLSRAQGILEAREQAEAEA